MSDGFFEIRYLSFTSDLDEFIDRILEERNIEKDNAVLIFGVNGGQGKFLVTLVIIDKSVRDDTSAKFKPTSFHKMLFPAEVEDIPENTYNMQVIFDMLDLEKISTKYKIVGDLKLYNVTLGMQSNG